MVTSPASIPQNNDRAMRGRRRTREARSSSVRTSHRESPRATREAGQSVLILPATVV